MPSRPLRKFAFRPLDRTAARTGIARSRRIARHFRTSIPGA